VHCNIDDTDTEDDARDCDATDVPSNAWMDEWKSYLNTHEDILEGMGIIQWWGVSTHLFYLHMSLMHTILLFHCS
jgi:hypothetical protein